MKIKVSFFAIVMLAALFLTHSTLSLAALLAAAFHEAAHIFAAFCCQIRIKELRLDIFGAALDTSGEIYSYKKECILAASGPLFNLAYGLLMLSASDKLPEFWQMFIYASVFLGILNLLPIKDFDGGRVVYCTIAQISTQHIAVSVQKILSSVFILSLWLLSVYLLLRRGASLSLFVFSVSLFVKIFMSVRE